MIDDILSSRIICGQPLAEDSTRKFFSDLVSSYEINELPLVMCNSLQKRTCLLYFNNEPCLVFDTYIIEIFQMLHTSLKFGCTDSFLKAIFYLLSSEQYFINGRYSLALQFAAKYLNAIEAIIDIIQFDIEQKDSSLIFIQQAFLLSHEIYHYWLSLDITRYEQAIKSKRKLLHSIYSYSQKRLDAPLNKDFLSSINDTNLIEECLCDSMGAINAIDIAIKLDGKNGSCAAAAIIESICYQFILSCIESFNGQINSKIIYRDLHGFNIRLLQLKTYLSKYLRNNFGDIVADQFQNDVAEINSFVRYAIKFIGQLYYDETLALKDFFYDDDKSINMNIRKQLLKLYSI